MAYDSIDFKTDGTIARITLNRPDRLNSFTAAMHAELRDALANLGDAGVLVLSGAGRGFCAGQDLGEALDPNGPGIKKIVEEHYNPIILKIRKIEKPVIAVVNGVAAGGAG